MHEIMAVAALPAHENIVGQYRAWQQGGHFNIQMELCDGGSLAQLLKEVSPVTSATARKQTVKVLTMLVGFEIFVLRC